MRNNFICTAYFRGDDGLGHCNTDCQWWNGGCPCAKGSNDWDGKDYDKQGRLKIFMCGEFKKQLTTANRKGLRG